ncbi:MAG: 16S rRNA (cytosine(1402)-N(4))-methyltransferase RsmH [Pseudomonadota bacterium]
MAAVEPGFPDRPPHIPVLLEPLIRAVAPVSGTWVDGTLGAGGYARGLLEAGAEKVIGIDRDPSVFPLAETWAAPYAAKVELVEDTFDRMDTHASEAAGVVLDLGVSSMQLDQAERGFSFSKDGPLDMRMGEGGRSAGDIVAAADEGDLADILYNYGEERASRRIARAIVTARAEAPITRTGRLADIIASVLPRPKPGQSHPATRSFQALRIAVNDEFGQLVRGLEAAERTLAEGGSLAVVTFHSIEDRVVKRFFQVQSGSGGRANRYAPETETEAPTFERSTRQAVGPDAAELASNPRARSARLRVGRRTKMPARPVDRAALGLPDLALQGGL